jgi:hypothetical protein
MGTHKNPFESNGFICGGVGHVLGCPFRGSRTKNLPLAFRKRSLRNDMKTPLPLQ